MKYTDYKPGDWIVFNETAGTSFGKVDVITKCTGSGRDYKLQTSKEEIKYPDFSGWLAEGCFRLALPHEIPNSIINNYQIY